MKWFVICLLIFFYSNLVAQNNLQGTVFLYKKKGTNTPLDNVYIEGPGSGSTITKQNGHYSFAFDNSIEFVKLTVVKDGYEIVNDEEIENLYLKKKSQQNIYLDFEGNTEKRKRELVDAATAQSKKRRDAYYKILDKGGKEAEQLKFKLAKEAGKKFSDFNEVRIFIANKMGADAKSIETVFKSIVRQNLDHANKDVEKIKEYTLKGMLDSALFLLDREKDRKQIMNADDQIKSANEIKKIIKAKYFAIIPLLIGNGLYDEVDSTYQIIISCDSSDVENYFEYGQFLENQNKLILAKKLYESLLNRNIDIYKKADILNLLAGLLAKYNQRAEAKKRYTEALEIYQSHSYNNSDGYLVDEAKIYTNLALLFDSEKNYDSSRLKYKAALFTYRYLQKKYPQLINLTNPDIATILNNYGILLISSKQYDSSLILLEESVSIRQKLAKNDPEKYLPDLASTYLGLAVLFKDVEKFDSSKNKYEEGLELFRQLVDKNPNAYMPQLESALYNYGNLLFDVNEYNSSQKIFEECIILIEKLVEKDSVLYFSKFPVRFGSLAKVLLMRQEFDSAKVTFQIALNMIKYSSNKSDNNDYLLSEADLLNNFSLLFIKTTQYDSAFKRAEEALNIYRLLASKNPLIFYERVAMSLSNIGSLFNNINKLDSAKERYLEALSIYDFLSKTNPNYLREVLSSLSELTKIAIRLNNLDDIIKYFKYKIQALELLFSINKDQLLISDIGNDCVMIGISYFNKDSIEQSKYYLEKALYSYHEAYYKKQDFYKSKIELIKPYLSEIYHKYTFMQLMNSNYDNAERTVMKALTLDSTSYRSNIDYAHTKLLQGKFEEAKAIYLTFIGNSDNPSNIKAYEQVILGDFEILSSSNNISMKRKRDIQRIKPLLK